MQARSQNFKVKAKLENWSLLHFNKEVWCWLLQHWWHQVDHLVIRCSLYMQPGVWLFPLRRKCRQKNEICCWYYIRIFQLYLDNIPCVGGTSEGECFMPNSCDTFRLTSGALRAGNVKNESTPRGQFLFVHLLSRANSSTFLFHSDVVCFINAILCAACMFYVGVTQTCRGRLDFRFEDHCWNFLTCWYRNYLQFHRV